MIMIENNRCRKEKVGYDICSRPLIPTKKLSDYVNDIELNSIMITSNEIEVLGTGSIEIIMYADSEDEDGFNDVFPCEFHLFLDMKFNIQKVETLNIDTSVFYE